VTIVIDIRDGEVVEQLQKAVTERGIRNAGIHLLGGVDSFTISTMPAHDATQDIVTTYDQPGELTGTGEVVDGQVHVHVVCGIEGDIAKAGHLHAATVHTFFVRAYVNVVES
jgi:predicted DNA-binding protein with PD1-like motif